MPHLLLGAQTAFLGEEKAHFFSSGPESEKMTRRPGVKIQDIWRFSEAGGGGGKCGVGGNRQRSLELLVAALDRANQSSFGLNTAPTPIPATAKDKDKTKAKTKTKTKTN